MQHVNRRHGAVAVRVEWIAWVRVRKEVEYWSSYRTNDRRVEVTDDWLTEFVAELTEQVVAERLGNEVNDVPVALPVWNDPIDDRTAVRDQHVPLGTRGRYRAASIGSPESKIIMAIAVEVSRDRSFPWTGKREERADQFGPPFRRYSNIFLIQTLEPVFGPTS